MNKEQQDRLWSELSEESKEEILELYRYAKEAVKESEYGNTIPTDLFEQRYGSHNLNPKPPTPKTWEDVAAQREYNIDVELNKIKNAWIGYPICDKMIATAKIAKLIELSYGGMVSEEEWKDEKLSKYYIEFVGEPSINCSRNDYRQFISFHSRELAEEFMSHESNRKLVEQYYMM